MRLTAERRTTILDWIEGLQGEEPTTAFVRELSDALDASEAARAVLRKALLIIERLDARDTLETAISIARAALADDKELG